MEIKMKESPKYRQPQKIEIENRQWPTRMIEKAPLWVPVDLRDGNQAFAKPMNVEKKIRYFKMLTAIGYKEIEAGYPAASNEEFEFVRRLIEEELIPDDVRIVVFTAARKDLIDRTVESIRGIKQAVVHCYAATSDLHREFVFHKSPDELKKMATDGTRMVVEALKDAGLYERCAYEFSPEEFSDSRLDYIVELAEEVREAWGRPGKGNFILNLPATVERRPPNQYADMIELFTRNYSGMGDTTLSIHTHNDQGCAIAAAEMAVLAGAERVEGTLCGHGERTGNMDLVTSALNLMSRGIETGLDFSNLPEIVRFVEDVSEIKLYPRHPYAGELVFTAFSGTHQDAIRKGMAQRKEISEYFGQGWKVPYLHIDPADLGRGYEGLIRINSQSGKGGVAYVLENVYGIQVPREMQKEVAQAVQKEAEASGGELSAEKIHAIFHTVFTEAGGNTELRDVKIRRPAPEDHSGTAVTLKVRIADREYSLNGTGGGPIEGAVAAFAQCPAIPPMQIESYTEHALGRGSDAQAIAFIGIRFNGSEAIVHGVGIDRSINIAAIRAIVNALNRKG
ncbi:MAG TPA: 2-isopropylmalate synthase [Lentisphaeria bacterium]|nr:2-isopropylmalate synthase [Lentisphaeria bacterium]HCG51042.1 2-isopropylmalate synthase [Lentisphaeria bacterium]